MKARLCLGGGARLIADEVELEVKQIMEGYVCSKGLDSTEYVRVRRISESDSPLVGYIKGWKGGRTSSRVISSYGLYGRKNGLMTGEQN